MGHDEPDAFEKSLEDSARDESERYVRRVDYDETDYGAQRTARNWINIDKLPTPLHSVRKIAAMLREKYGAIGVALRQRDRCGMLDPVTEACVARTTKWGYEEAPSRPFGLVLAGPTAPARGVRIEPVRPFGVDPGARPETRHTKLWRVFLVSLYGPLTGGLYPFGWEAPLTAKVRPNELDTEESALAQWRIEALVDPLGYVLDFVARTVMAFERYQPSRSRRLGLLISMGRRDQEVAVNGLRQDRRGESLAAHAGWAAAVRKACGNLVPVVEVAHPEYEQQLIDDLHYVSSENVIVAPESLVDWFHAHARQPDWREWEYLAVAEGGVPSVLLAGRLCDRRTGHVVGRLVLALPDNAPVRLLAIPNQLDTHGDATVAPALTGEERVAVSNVITAWAAENNFTGACRRKTWFGWYHFSSSAANVDQLELAYRVGAAIRFWNIEFGDDGPVGV
jgi:hypothetical protein